MLLDPGFQKESDVFQARIAGGVGFHRVLTRLDMFLARALRDENDRVLTMAKAFFERGQEPVLALEIERDLGNEDEIDVN